MNYFLLAETDFFRLINEAGDCNMETAYTAFATQVIELCNGGMDMNLTVIALAYIEIELQHHPVRNLSEEKREIAAYVSKALSFVRKMQKFLATPQVPPLISANNVLIVYFISFGGPRCPLFLFNAFHFASAVGLNMLLHYRTPFVIDVAEVVNVGRQRVCR